MSKTKPEQPLLEIVEHQYLILNASLNISLRKFRAELNKKIGKSKEKQCNVSIFKTGIKLKQKKAPYGKNSISTLGKH